MRFALARVGRCVLVVFAILAGGTGITRNSAWAQGAEETVAPRPDPGVSSAAAPAPTGFPEIDGSCPGAELFGGTEIERAAYCAFRGREMVSLRTLARQAAEADPEGFRPQFLLGVAQHRGEGNLPKSLHHLELAENIFTAENGRNLDEGHPLRIVGYQILAELMDVHGEMDHHEARIAYAEEISQRLGIEHLASTAWPLMKLGRFDEAREVAEAALGSDDEWSRNVARTSLCAIESEQRHREAAYAACKLAAEPAEDRSRGGAVELTNAGAASEETMRFSEAEKYYLEASRRAPETSVNPWGRLTHLYLSQGRFSEAINGLLEMEKYRAARPRAYLDQQDEAEATLIKAALMLVAGWPDLAEELTRGIVDRPDRQGTSSASAEQSQAGAALFARAVYRAHARLLEEEASVAPFWEGLELWAQAQRLRLSGWLIGRQATEALAKPERLITTLRPEVPGSLELPSWLDAEVIDLVGPGVAQVALDQAQAEESLDAAQTEPVFAAYAAEIRWRAGDDAEALTWAQRAMDAEVRGFTLVAARAAAIAGDAARSLGKPETARAAFRRALDRDPSVFRVLDISLPVRLSGEGPVGRAAAKLLDDSPAFSVVGWGLPLVVGDAQSRLMGVDGSTLVTMDTGDARPPREVASEVHRQLFAPVLDMAQVSADSLDGRVGNQLRANEVFERLMRKRRK